MKRRHLKGQVFVISGPSGSGKTTLVTKLLKDRSLSRKLKKSVSLTTRPKRLMEREGRDYFFISEEEFRQALQTKKILEWTKYLGYYYATPKEFIDRELKKGKDVVLCLDLAGARRIKKLYPENSTTIFIKPPSMEKLKDRIEGRGEKSGEDGIKARLGLAREELAASSTYDYRIINNTLEQAITKLKDIIKSKTRETTR